MQLPKISCIAFAEETTLKNMSQTSERKFIMPKEEPLRFDFVFACIHYIMKKKNVFLTVS